MLLDGVDVFVAIVQTGSFAGAAKLLNMPAATVSTKMARLEQRLGVTLVQRSTRRLHVTDVGRTYYDHCAEGLRAILAGQDILAARHGGPAGVLRISSSTDGAQHVLPPLIDRFLAAYPNVAVDLQVTNRQVNLVAEGIDLALRGGPMKDSPLQSRKFGTARLALFASKKYLEEHRSPKTPEELKVDAVMAHSRFYLQGVQMRSDSHSFKLAPASRARADDMQTLMMFALQGMGIALLPDAGKKAAEVLGLVKLLPNYAFESGNLYFVYPGGKFTPVNVRTFIDMALDQR